MARVGCRALIVSRPFVVTPTRTSVAPRRHSRLLTSFGTFSPGITKAMTLNLGSAQGCGLAMPRSLAGANPAPVTASHGPGIEPCRHHGNEVLDA